ncbi:MAG: hypothetical protein ACPGLV_09175 [Bacteroidia bacterium]
MRFLFIILLHFPLLLYSQNQKYSWADKNIKSFMFYQAYSEMGRTQWLSYTNSDNELDLISFEYRTLVSIAYLTKINLYSKSDYFSISIAPNVSLQFNELFEDLYLQNYLDGMALGIIPALEPFLDFNLGNRSTYNSTHKYGISAGIGFKAGLFFNDITNMKVQPVYSPRIRIGFTQTLNFTKYSTIGFYLTSGIYSSNQSQNILNFDLARNGLLGISLNYTMGYKTDKFFF